MEGPDSIYAWSGYTSLSVKAYLNSIHLDVTGHKVIKFKDGSEIIYNNQNDIFGNTLIGTFYHQLIGTITFDDFKNGIRGVVNIGMDKKRQKDYFTGRIEKISTGESLC